MSPCYDNVQAAVDAADDPGDVIKVAAGTYSGVSNRGIVTQVVYISKTLAVQGGYTTTNWTVSDPVAHPTTLNAGGQGRVFYVRGDIDVTLQGLRITGGVDVPLDEGCGGGVFVYESSLAFRDNQVYGNRARYGGGVCVWYSDHATLGDNAIHSNTAKWGGGLELYDSSPQLERNAIYSNTASSAGGGMTLSDSYATFEGNTIVSNTAPEGGAVWIHEDSSLRSTNDVYADNRADTGGSAIHAERYTELYLQHGTLARNTGDAGIHFESGHIEMTNTILVGHTTGLYAGAGATAQSEGTLWGSGAWANGSDWAGAGTILTGTINLWGDPAFADPGAGNYHITFGSAAIDAGVDAGITQDIDGEPRPAGGGYDIGADELAHRSLYLPLVMNRFRQAVGQ
jgi:parallel beta-helix repeat protein